MKYKVETIGEWAGELRIYVGEKLVKTVVSDRDFNLTITLEAQKNERLRLDLADVQNLEGFKVLVSKLL